MSQYERIVIKKSFNLDETSLASARLLAELCEEYDKSSPCIQWKHDLNAHKGMESWFLAYEEETVVGILAIFGPFTEEIEITGCVHPQKRQRGIWKDLLLAAMIVTEAFPIKRILYVCDRSSKVGGSYIQGLRLRIQHTEYAMKLNKESILPSTTPISVRLATQEDINAMALVGADSFGETVEDSKHFLEAAFQSEHRKPYCGVVQGEIVSICALTYVENSIGINGLGVPKSKQGKGYGKATIVALLKQIISDERDIVLDVDSSNKVAYPLYLSLGFQETQIVDYWLEEKEKL